MSRQRRSCWPPRSFLGDIPQRRNVPPRASRPGRGHTRGLRVPRVPREQHGGSGLHIHPLVRAFAERDARQQTTSPAPSTEPPLISSGSASTIRPPASICEPDACGRRSARSGRCRVVAEPEADLHPRRMAGSHARGLDSGESENPWFLVTKARILNNRLDSRRRSSSTSEPARCLSGVGDKEGLLPVLIGSAFCLLIRAAGRQPGRHEEVPVSRPHAPGEG